MNLKLLIKLRDAGQTWDELAKQFKPHTPNALRKTYYRNIRKEAKREKTHIVIPDCQVKSGVDISYLTCIGNYIAEKKPDVIVCIGDFADMPSLSSYDVGKKTFEGRRYKKDIEATREGMKLLMAPIKEAMKKDKKWKPELELFLGNHEDRINRCISSDPKLDGTLSIDDLQYESFGWNVNPFLEVKTVDGIAYAHYFTAGIMGKPVGSSRALVQKKHVSCVMGHNQNWEMHREVRADGSAIMGLFVGSCYLHNEDYLGPQGNNYGRQIWVLHEVDGNGSFLPKPVSLNHLIRNYTEV